MRWNLKDRGYHNMLRTHRKLALISLAGLMFTACNNKGIGDSDDPVTYDEVCATPPEAEPLNPGTCELIGTQEFLGSGYVYTVTYQYVDGLLVEKLADYNNESQGLEQYTYDEQGRRSTMEWSDTSGAAGIVTYSYDEDGRLVDAASDVEKDGVLDHGYAYTYDVDGTEETVTTERYSGDDGSVSSRSVETDDTDRRRLTYRFDEDSDGNYEFQWHSWYNTCGDSEVIEGDVDGDGYVDVTDFNYFEYNDWGFPLVEESYTESGGQDTRKEYTYLSTGHLAAIDVYSLDDEAWVLEQIVSYDWSGCDLSTIDVANFRP